MSGNATKSIKELPRHSDEGSRATFVTNVIFERAIELFLEKGFSSTSMNDLAKACKVSKPALYYYFPNKSALLEMLYDHITADFYDLTTLVAKSEGSPRRKLIDIITHQTKHNIEQRRFLTVFWRERYQFEGGAKKKLADRERGFERLVMGLLEDGKQAGEFHHENSKLAVMSILGLLSTLHRWAHHTGASTEEVARSVVSLVMDGLCCAPSPPDAAQD